MATIKTQEQTKVLLSESNSRIKTVLFMDQITKLLAGQALHITNEEWPLRTSPASYYYRTLRKGKDKATHSVNKVKDGFLITKL
jgi:hypothetical protein